MVRKATDAQPNEYWVPARPVEMASGSERIVLGDNRIRRGTLDWHIQKTYSTSESFEPLLGPGIGLGSFEIPRDHRARRRRRNAVEGGTTQSGDTLNHRGITQ